MKNKWTILFVVALLIAGGLSLFASGNPDGLEVSAEFIGLSWPQTNYVSLMPDYQIMGINNKYLSASLAGLIGTTTIYLLILLIGKLTNKKSKQKNSPSA